MTTAWIVGASGAWGHAVAIDLWRRGWDVVALGRHDVPELEAWAARLERGWRWVRFDLASPDPVTLPDEPPDLLVVCAAVVDGSREELLRVDYLGPVALIEQVAARMAARGTGRIGVFMGQNARLGMAGLGDFSAAQAALWTWCEALQDRLARDGSGVTLTRVIPPRTASSTQRGLAELSGRSARLHRPDARPLMDAVLAGRSRAGRRPVLAAISTLLR